MFIEEACSDSGRKLCVVGCHQSILLRGVAGSERLVLKIGEMWEIGLKLWGERYRFFKVIYNSESGSHISGTGP